MASISVSNVINRCRTYADTISGRVDDSTWRTLLSEWLKRAARDYNLPWARRVTPLLVYEGVYEYAVPSDYRSVIAPEKPISEDQNDDAWFLFQIRRAFARNRNNRNDLSVAYDRPTPFFNIRYDDTALSNQLLHSMDSVTANGTWSISGGSGLDIDENNFRQGAASIRFNVTVAGTVTLTNSTFTAINLEADNHQERSTIFVWLYLPATGVTSIALRFGSDASNYWEDSVTANFNGSAFHVGWNLLGFEWDGATQTGSVDETAIDYLRLALTAAGVGNNYRVDHVVSRMPKMFDLNYYSTNLVQTNAGAFQETVTANDDLILGDTEFEDCAVFYSVMQAAKYVLKDADLVALAKDDFERAFSALRVKHPDMAPKVQHSYFNDRHLAF